ncbi:uncharacterized protein METZ01_LOCUS88375, partial [marine metagenome]
KLTAVITPTISPKFNSRAGCFVSLD